MKKFITPSWQDILIFNGIEGFESLWCLNIERVDKPNRKGRGWSEVGKISLDLPGGNKTTAYIDGLVKSSNNLIL